MNGFYSLRDVEILKLDVGTQTPKHMCLKGLTGLEYRAHMIFDMNELLCFWAMGPLTINDWDRSTIWGMQGCSLLLCTMNVVWATLMRKASTFLEECDNTKVT